jgi:integrase
VDGGADRGQAGTVHDPGYQTELRLFSEYLCDGRYGWAVACEEAFGTHPVPICHEWNTIAHLNDYEGRPEARPFTREELQRFLDYADDQVERAVVAKRKGGLAAYRDATVFKVIYGWGLRRTETAKLDLADWGRNPAAPGVRPLRDVARALRQGGARAAAAAAQRALGDGLGG